MTRAEKWQIVIRVIPVTALLGGLIGLIPGYIIGDGSPRSLIAGGLIGLLIAAGMVTFEVSWAVGLISRRWLEAPFLVVLFTRSLAWLAIIVSAITIPLISVGQIPLAELVDTSFVASVSISFGMALLVNFVSQVNRLLGRGVLVGLLLGRYHRPREEVRIFLMIDLRDSTEIAERLGNLRYHAFLRRFIGDVTASALRHGAEVHRYVGDEVILTWTEQKGLADAACVRSVFAMADAIDAADGEYTANFGIVPRFWAGLHLGPVVTGEIGTVKHEIAFLGDTLNTSARIEKACREYSRPFIASSDVIEALQLPAGVQVEELGPVDLRGVGSSVELLAISRAR